MNMEHVWGAVIAGGQGTRLFPISHTDRPKQFCRLDDKHTFIQAAIENLAAIGIKRTQIVVVTTSDNQTKLAHQQTLPHGILSQNICQVSPSYGYAGAMVKIADFIYELDRRSIIVNTPADQYLVADGKFQDTVNRAINEIDFGCQTNGASRGVIVGVKINDLVTAMGCGHAIYDASVGYKDCYPVLSFVEKPSKEVADRIMRQGNSACNTGINVWSSRRLLEAVPLDKAKGLSTDGLMEALGAVSVSVGTFEWRDCGTLKSLYEISKKTPNHKNASLGEGTFQRIECRRSLLYSADGMELRVTGAEDDAVIFTTINERPIVVVAKLDESQRIKALAEDYLLHETFLTDDFSVGARNNTVLRSNVSDELIVGFVGVENYAVYVYRRPDGMMEAAVSQQLGLST